jgi:hypothetical protein
MIKKLLALVLMTIAIIPAGVPPAAMAKTHLAEWILFSKKWVLPTRAGWILFRSSKTEYLKVHSKTNA